MFQFISIIDSFFIPMFTSGSELAIDRSSIPGLFIGLTTPRKCDVPFQSLIPLLSPSHLPHNQQPHNP